MNEAHNNEGCIVMFFSCHCEITNCEHIVDMIKQYFYLQGNCENASHMCTNINKMCYVLILKELTDDIGSKKLSLLLDDSNDISIIKLLGTSFI